MLCDLATQNCVYRYILCSDDVTWPLTHTIKQTTQIKPALAPDCTVEMFLDTECQRMLDRVQV